MPVYPIVNALICAISATHNPLIRVGIAAAGVYLLKYAPFVETACILAYVKPQYTF
ncbi:hypothetical protein HMPREF0454_00723 [Hafnia alvei ATCC 51873]|uniref:Uncharacterized protein n=1 Tax=Hafnia alvei ATCC 51873 TaxID=1002364 RepID=G9Y2B1_HAFAL|nr:hypothetical protein HMPREF0454_00723 [Hafnia alvei ATCC 51873]